MNRMLAVASATWHKALRQPAYWIILVAGAVLVLTSPAFALFGMGESSKLVVDLGLATIGLAGLLAAIVICWATVIVELEDQTAMALLAKPLRPITYVLGKYVGVAVSVAVIPAVLTMLLLATVRGMSPEPPRYFALQLLASLLIVAGAIGASVRWRRPKRETWAVLGMLVAGAALLVMPLVTGVEGQGCRHSAESAAQHSFHSWRWDVAGASALQTMGLFVICSVTVALSMRFPLVPVATISGAAFILGNMANYLAERLESSVGSVAVVVRVLLPNLENYNVAEAVALGRGVPAEVFCWGALHGALYVAAMLAVATWAFGGRELR